MKKKSLLSLLLVLSMLISTIIPVSADYTSAAIIAGKTVPGWEDTLKSTGGDDLKGIQVGITDGDAKSGELSLCAIFPNKKLTSNNYYLTNTDVQVSIKAGKTYTVGVWYKVDSDVKDAYKSWTFFAVGEPTGSIPQEIYELSKTESGDVDGWKHRYLTFTATKDETGPLRFGFCPNFSHITDRTEVKILFDDIYFREEGSEVNYVYNPSFEETVESPEVEPDEPEIGDGKTMAGWSDLQSTGDGTTTVVAPSEDAAKTGDMSLSVTFQAGTTGYREYIQNTLTEVTLKAGVEYEIGYWYQYFAGMASTGNAKPFMAIGDVTGSHKVTIGAFSSEKPADGGWRNVYVAGNYIPEEDVTGYVSFGFNVQNLADGSTILIDDIYIRAVGSNVNLVPNPSFEETWEAPEVEPDEPEVTPEPGFNPQIIADKTVPYWGTLASTGGDDLKGIKVGYTDYDKKSGSLSLCAIFPNKSLTSNNYYLTNTDVQVSVKAGKTYTVGVWYKTDEAITSPHKTWTFFAVGDPSSGVYELATTDSEKVDGWKHRYLTFTASEDKTGPLYFGFCPNMSHVSDRTEVAFLFDDIYFIEEGSDVNYVYNPSFEETWEVPEIPDEPVVEFAPEMIEGKTMQGWSGLGNSSGEDKGVRVGATDYATRTGDLALYASFPNKKTWQKDYIVNTNAPVTIKAGTKYNFGIWYKTTDGLSKPQNCWPFMSVGALDTLYLEINTKGETVDGWTLLSGTATATQDATGDLFLGFEANFSHITDQTEIKFVFDDVYLKEDGSDVNLIPNESFEEKWEAPRKPAEGWTDLATTNGDNLGVSAKLTEVDAKSGASSLSVKFPNKKTYQKHYIKNTLTQVTLKPGKTYKFGVWYKVDDAVTKQHQSWPFFAIGGVSTVWDLATTETEAVNGWKHRFGTITVEEEIKGALYFGFDPNFAHVTDREEIEILFDDIYFCEEGTDVNFVYNPSFEETLAEPFNGMAGWSEPAVTGGDQKGVRINTTEEDVKSGEVALSVIFPNVKTYQKHYISNTGKQVTLKAGKTYTFGVWYKVDDAITKQHQSWPFFAIGGVSTVWDLATTETETVDGWKHRWGTVTVEEDITGNLYFGFDPNFGHVTDRIEIEVLFDDIYFREEGTKENLVYNPSFEKTFNESTISIDGWSEPVTTGGDHKGVSIKSTDADAIDGSYALSVTFPNTKTYQKHYIKNTTGDVTLVAGKTYKFGVWYKVDDSITKQHQSWPFFAIGGVSTVWDLATTEAETVNGWKHRWGTVTVEEDMTGALYFGFDPNLAHVTDRTEIEFLFDNIYFCEEGTDVNLVYNGSFEVKEWSVEGYEFDIISGDETVASNIASLKEGENSEVLAKVKIKNNLKEDFKATAIVALYENNALVEFNFIEQDIPVAADFFENSTLGCSVSVPVMDPEKTYQIKVMLWNSLSEMIPIVEAYVFE